MLSAAKSMEIHSDDNRVYFHLSVGFYVIRWVETGNSDIPYVVPIPTPTPPTPSTDPGSIPGHTP